MADKKLLKTALIISVALLLLCIAACAGSTYAWFTDYTSSDLNTIKVGTLDVELEFSHDGQNWHDVQSTTRMFDKDASWLPGHSQHVYLRISNKGSLALKYKLSMNILKETGSINMLNQSYKLSEYLQVGATTDQSKFTSLNVGDKAFIKETATKAFDQHVNLLTAANPAIVEAYLGPDESQIVALIVRMPEDLDEEINYPDTVNGPKLIFGIDVVAGQQMKESDSFGDDYDKDATYPEIGSPALLEKYEREGWI